MSNYAAPVLWCEKSIYDAEPEVVAFAPSPRQANLNGIDYVIVSEALKVAEIAVAKGYAVGMGGKDLDKGFKLSVLSVTESLALIPEFEGDE